MAANSKILKVVRFFIIDWMLYIVCPLTMESFANALIQFTSHFRHLLRHHYNIVSYNYFEKNSSIFDQTYRLTLKARKLLIFKQMRKFAFIMIQTTLDFLSTTLF